MHPCYGTDMGARGQLWGISLLLPPHGSEAGTQDVHPLSHLPGPKLEFYSHLQNSLAYAKCLPIPSSGLLSSTWSANGSALLQPSNLKARGTDLCLSLFPSPFLAFQNNPGPCTCQTR